MEDHSNKFIIFCDYNTNYPHNAIFCRSSFLHDKCEKQLNELIKLFDQNNGNDNPNIIISRLKLGSNPNDKPHMSYNINDRIDESKETNDLINYWLSLIRDDDDYFTKSVNDGKNNVIPYYIKDENKYLSPIDLYHKLLSMTNIYGHEINVERCFMISQASINFKPSICLRFFARSDKWLSCEEIKNVLMRDNRILRIIPSSRDGVIFAGFGFIYVDNLETHKQLQHTCHDIDNIHIDYDT
jgi:hypothetical protein